jgi:hypothetical protein
METTLREHHRKAKAQASHRQKSVSTTDSSTVECMRPSEPQSKHPHQKS